jgi:hypothetical protein
MNGWNLGLTSARELLSRRPPRQEWPIWDNAAADGAVYVTVKFEYDAHEILENFGHLG